MFTMALSALSIFSILDGGIIQDAFATTKRILLWHFTIFTAAAVTIKTPATNTNEFPVQYLGISKARRSPFHG